MFPRIASTSLAAAEDTPIARFCSNRNQAPDDANGEEDGSDVVGSVVDFAGNESDVVVTSAVARGGCASVPAAPMSLLALGLLFRRRRLPAN